MSETLLPQKRNADDTEVKQHYQTRSTATAEVKKPIAVINKFKPIVSYKPIDFTPLDAATAKSTYDEKFYTADDIPHTTRRGFQYSACAPNPLLSVMKFGTTDIEPYNACLNVFDKSVDSLISEDRMSVTTDKGWRSIRANIPITEGNIYFEFNIIKSDEQSHVRVGVGRREASLEAPIGFDGYGYGLRDKTGQKIHLSRPASFMDGFKTGDVIGILLELPKETEFQDVVRNQIAIRYKNRVYFEKFDYTPSKEMEHLLNPVTVFGEKAVLDKNSYKPPSIKGSKLKVYKNGEFIGTPFEELYAFDSKNSQQKNNKINPFNNDGTLGYYPAISVFNGGIAELNPGPNFRQKFDEDTRVTAYCELYDDKIIKDIVWDLIDEMEAESLPL